MSRLSHVQRAALTAVALSTMAVGACTPVGPAYKRPDLAPPAVHRGAPAAAVAETLADVPWWQVFDDPALQGLVRDAIANNPDLRLAVARVRERFGHGRRRRATVHGGGGEIGTLVGRPHRRAGADRDRRQRHRGDDRARRMPMAAHAPAPW